MVIEVGRNLTFTSGIDTDIITRHALPGLERMEKHDRDNHVNNLQVIKKTELLGIGKRDFLYPELSIESIEKNVKKLSDKDATQKVVFRGTTSLELQYIINENPNKIIDVQTPRIRVSDTIILRGGTLINGNGVKLTSDGVKFGILGEEISNIFINDICIEGNMEYGMCFVNCNHINVSSCKINGLQQNAIFILGTTDGLYISENVVCGNQSGGIYIVGNVSNGIIEYNDIRNNGGTSNLMAGIVMTNTILSEKHDIWDTFDEAHRFPCKESLYGQLDCPHHLIVRNNRVMDNNSSGIYCDGAYLCYVLNNTVSRNDKEGICLDFGTVGLYLKENVFKENGRRIRQTDDDLRKDYVLGAGRMEDGSAKAKLPGVSLDNTAYNILENNIVANNYGSGIKMVRTTVRTLILENIVKDNNMGWNDVYHFFGIELGAAPSGKECDYLDFTPDFENIICRNSITGNHYSGVFIGEDCYVNDVFDNVIMEPQVYAVEAISGKFNSIVNNLSNAGVRNEYQVDLQSESAKIKQKV